jgi:lipopolysaccharide export system ATP-binding protein
MDTLKIEHLKKNYKGKLVVKDVSLTINSGEIIGLLGPNGAGKTTSFYIILGMIPQDLGAIYLNDRDISRLKMHERARLGIGYLPQEPSIFRKLTVQENIMAVLELRPNLTQEQRQTICTKLLTEFHLDSLQDNLGFSLSGGERRRVEIARALALEPKFILLDEPFAGIDPISIIDIKHIIHELHLRQIGVLITDHNVRETLDICHRAYIVNVGEIIATGTPPEILQNTQVRKVYLGENFTIN